MSKQLLLESFYREKARLLKLYCEELRIQKMKFKGQNLGANCFKDKANSLGSSYLIPNYSTRLRKLNAVKQGKGKIQFSSLLLNDYGKKEGSPGGYGSSPKNRF